MTDRFLQQLKSENAALRAELRRHGLALPETVSPYSQNTPRLVELAAMSADAADCNRRQSNVVRDEGAIAHSDVVRPPSVPRAVALSVDEKVRLFRSLFRGRDDVYALRWENPAKGTSGYAPARTRGQGIPSVAFSSGPQDRYGRQCLQLTDEVIRRHLLGEHVVGLYPLDNRGRCRFVVADFDDGGWRDDAIAFARTCASIDVPALMEISRSGEGAHAWCFFDEPVDAVDARRLMTALLGRTCREQRLLALSSYDRLIPNQDEMPNGGFGSLVALPLQRRARMSGASVFTDAELEPFEDPWAALESVRRIATDAVHLLIERASEGESDTFALGADQADRDTPWRAPRRVAIPRESLPTSIRITLADGIYIDRTGLPLSLVTGFARLAAFRNPQWFEHQRQHRSVWNVPMFVDKARNLPRHVWLPRGCLEAVRALIEAVADSPATDDTPSVCAKPGMITDSVRPIELVIDDERAPGTPIDGEFAGLLRSDQNQALTVMMRHETGVLVAPPGFGKTVTAAAIIASRATSTLVLVHRKDLLRQWRSRLATFLEIEPKQIGVLGGGLKTSLTGLLDIAVVQALTRRDDLALLLEGYGQVVVDECHHVGAPSIDRVLSAARPRYLLGLTATPERRDGLEPIVAMQCGSIRHRVAESSDQPRDLAVRFVAWNVVPDIDPDAHIQAVLSAAAADDARTGMLADIALNAWKQGGKLLVLTERKSHVVALETALRERGVEPLVLHGGLSSKRRLEAVATLDALDPHARRCLLATGRLVGEGFDHPPLDTLVLAMPLSWRGTLEQYVGRLHRPSAGKHAVRVIDVDDSGHPMLVSMRRKREAGYRALGYRREEEGQLF